MGHSPPPPPPSFILRHHSAQINAIFINNSNTFIYSGDADGIVAITDTVTRRPSAIWRAHDDGVLGIEEWRHHGIITSGRDNKLHVFCLPMPIDTLGDISKSSVPPRLLYSMDINALNYCRFSMLVDEGSDSCLIALPNLTDSENIDIFELPSKTRPHAAIGYVPSIPSIAGRGAMDPDKTGLVMSLHLLSPTCLIVGYETGAVALYEYEGPEGGVSDARLPDVGRGAWKRRWREKVHAEAIMSLAVSPDKKIALTTSADHLIVRYTLVPDLPEGVPRAEMFKTKQVGNASVSIKSDGKVCAAGGWDGSIRLYSTRSLKSLGTLSFHRDTCHVVTFAQAPLDQAAITAAENSDSDDEEANERAQETRKKWLVSGGHDGRVAVWELMEFERKKRS